MFCCRVESSSEYVHQMERTRNHRNGHKLFELRTSALPDINANTPDRQSLEECHDLTSTDYRGGKQHNLVNVDHRERHQHLRSCDRYEVIAGP